MIYDSVLVGSGPINIFEALYLRRKGQKVLIVDEHDRIGGAWATIRHEGLPELEIGCHVWDIDARVFGFLARFLGLDLRPLKPQPKILYGSLRLPYDWKNNALFFNRAALPWDRFRLSLVPAKYYYPSGGSAELMAALKRKLQEDGVDVWLSRRAARIDIKTDRNIVSTGNGEEISCNDTVLTSLSPVEEITARSHSFCIRCRPKQFIHLHLVYAGQLFPRFSYVRVYRDPIIHRISDITSQIARTDRIHHLGYRVLLVGVYVQPFHEMSRSKLIATITHTLKQKGLLSEAATLVSSYDNVFTSRQLEQESFETIQRLAPAVRLRRTAYNFTYSIAEQLSRWKDVLW